jgi:hypothetical protein
VSELNECNSLLREHGRPAVHCTYVAVAASMLVLLLLSHVHLLLLCFGG